MATDRDAQRRELEEIRRKFTEMGARVGSLFEPAPEEDPAADAHPTTPAPPPPPPPPAPAPAPVPVAGPGAGGLSRVVAAVAVAVALLVGVGLGYLLPRSSAQRAASAAPPLPGTQAPTTSTQAARVVTRVPPACLETARKGDLTIHLYTINVRDRRLVEALKAYTLASQACRKEASP
jgi:hypothetical protein